MTSFITPKIWQAYKQPNFQKQLKTFTHTTTISNELCGDSLTVWLDIKDNHLINTYFTASGCSLVTAGATLYLDTILNKPIDEIKTDSSPKWLNQFEPNIPPARHSCIIMGLRTVKQALEAQES